MPVSTEYDGEEAYQMRIVAKRYAQKPETASQKQQARSTGKNFGEEHVKLARKMPQKTSKI